MLIGDRAATSRWLRITLLSTYLAAGYVVTGGFGLSLAAPPGYATGIFLPAGLAIATMLVFGTASLPGTFLGSFLLNIGVGYTIAHQLNTIGIVSALAIAAASAVQAWVGGHVLGRAIGRPLRLDSGRDVFWFLTLAPIVCLTSATLSLSCLVLIGAIGETEFPASWPVWWIGDTLGLVLVLPLMLVFAGERQALRKRRIFLVAVPMVLFFGVFAATYTQLSRREADRGLLEFRMRSQRLTDKVQSTLEEQAVFLEQLGTAFGTRRSLITRGDFRLLSEKLLRRFPMIQAIDWAPRVGVDDRAGFETAQRVDVPTFTIHGLDDHSSAGAIPRPFLFPVTFLEPLGGNAEAQGFDLASDGDRLAAITSAETSKQVSATAPLRLVQEDGDQAAILLIYPVSESPNGPGIVVVVLRVQTFVERLLAPLSSAIKLKLSDATSGRPLFDNIDEQAVTPIYEASFEFGTRRYLLRTAPTRLYLASHFGWESWFILVAGVLCTGLLGALLLLATGYGQRADDLVEERTAELQTANRRLSTEIAERERAEAALLQARRMEAIGQLTGGVAHDFNNLLSIIQGNLDLLRKHIQTKRAADILTAADRGAQRGAQLVASLLAFARRQMLRPETIDPNQLIREFSDLIQRAVGDAIELHLVLRPTAGLCCVDPAQFQAALLNLAVNARDAMLDGGSLTIECGGGASGAPALGSAETAEDGGYVVIAVRDNGRGMTPEVMERAFEPFYTTKDVGVGSGLGLSQVYGFVQQSGGQVEIASAPGNGTIVTIYLPRHDRPPAAAGDDKAAKARAPRGNEIVLVVEDDADVRQLAANLLRELGYRVLTAADGIEAISILRGDEPIDLLFSDIVMPKGLRGDKLVSKAKTLRPDLRILLTSGYTAELEVGTTSAVTVLRKPYRRDDLAHAIRAALDSEQQSTLSS